MTHIAQRASEEGAGVGVLFRGVKQAALRECPPRVTPISARFGDFSTQLRDAEGSWVHAAFSNQAPSPLYYKKAWGKHSLSCYL